MQDLHDNGEGVRRAKRAYIYIYIYIYPGGLRPDRRAPGDFAEKGACEISVFSELYVHVYIFLNTFFQMFLETFSSGGVPPDAPGGAKVSLAALAVTKCVFHRFLNDLGVHLGTLWVLISAPFRP